MSSKKDYTGTGFEHYTKCSKCQKLIPLEEPYTETIISKEILCSECDKGILDEGDIFLAIE